MTSEALTTITLIISSCALTFLLGYWAHRTQMRDTQPVADTGVVPMDGLLNCAVLMCNAETAVSVLAEPRARTDIGNAYCICVLTDVRATVVVFRNEGGDLRWRVFNPPSRATEGTIVDMDMNAIIEWLVTLAPSSRTFVHPAPRSNNGRLSEIIGNGGHIPPAVGERMNVHVHAQPHNPEPAPEPEPEQGPTNWSGKTRGKRNLRL